MFLHYRNIIFYNQVERSAWVLCCTQSWCIPHVFLLFLNTLNISVASQLLYDVSKSCLFSWQNLNYLLHRFQSTQQIINKNYIYSLQLHVSTHMNHLQARNNLFALSLCSCLGSQNEHSDIANKYSSSLKTTRESKHVAINYKYIAVNLLLCWLEPV